MPIDSATSEWLEAAGYRNHCFISWPHNVSQRMGDFARALHQELEEQLAEQVASPQVFLDESDLPPGTVWPEQLRRELCSSLCMVALCAPIYFHKRHRFCGLEWAAMELLGRIRLEDPSKKTIIPLKLSDLGKLPVAVRETQWIDVSRDRLRGRYLHTNGFRQSVERIVKRIEEIAVALHARRAVPACDQFQFPQQSAFTACRQAKRHLPLSA